MKSELRNSLRGDPRVAVSSLILVVALGCFPRGVGAQPCDPELLSIALDDDGPGGAFGIRVHAHGSHVLVAENLGRSQPPPWSEVHLFRREGAALVLEQTFSLDPPVQAESRWFGRGGRNFGRKDRQEGGGQ